ncbi:MAG: guanylate kinase [Deltaproteobacteria bacterium]|nr:guanylate kinase [Deltaproteobacteria bacterium]
MSGNIFVITAPSGTGKTTLLKELLKADDRLRFSISFTTRPPRSGEVHGQDYFFISIEEFRRLQEQGDLVECVEQFGYWYGTSKAWIKGALAGGGDLVFDLDTRGARAVKGHFPQAVLIFILPPDLTELKRRLQVRGDLPPEELQRRLEQGRAELREVSWYDFLVVNDQFEQALAQLKAIIVASRLRVSRAWPELAPRFLP